MGVLESFRLEGKRALVTGGSKGLGKTIAIALAEAGANVMVVSRTAAECEAAAREVAAISGRRTRAHCADVTVSTDIDRLADEVGDIDILVNNAGINRRGATQGLTEDDWDCVVDTNLKGSFLLSRLFGPTMADRGWGRIINLGSIMSAVALPGRAPYASAKAGLLGLTRALALEWAEDGVTVNALCPGPFATEMNAALLKEPDKARAFIAKVPMGRWGELSEIAGAAVFLASDASSFMTGACLFVDGGWTAQ